VLVVLLVLRNGAPHQAPAGKGLTPHQVGGPTLKDMEHANQVEEQRQLEAPAANPAGTAGTAGSATGGGTGGTAGGDTGAH
jgi:hypothetical protein